MQNSWFIKNGLIINEGQVLSGHILIREGLIDEVFYGNVPTEEFLKDQGIMILDACGHYVMPGVIDDQVHFREPGLTHKGDLFSESRAAVAGGITSFMDMPNTLPQTISRDALEKKFALASGKSAANYSFYLGATNDNIEEIRNMDMEHVCGLKVFMGASTGNMLVDNEESLEAIFREAPGLIAIHSEYEPLIRENSAHYKKLFGEELAFRYHPAIRSAEACFRSSRRAVELAKKHDSRLHILHLSTAAETALLSPGPVRNKRITAEVCVHHLFFSEDDYERLGARIKWNPAIKSSMDRDALWEALLNGRIDIVATDHAPHTLEEKAQSYFKCPSGAPMVQHSLPLMFEFVKKGKITAGQLVDKMCHQVADCFRIKNRGYMRKGFYADLCILNPDMNQEVTTANILYKCGWSPLEGMKMRAGVTHTFVNGQLAWENGRIHDEVRGQALEFRPD